VLWQAMRPVLVGGTVAWLCVRRVGSALQHDVWLGAHDHRLHFHATFSVSRGLYCDFHSGLRACGGSDVALDVNNDCSWLSK